MSGVWSLGSRTRLARLALGVILLLVGALPVLGQEPDTVKTTRERILERLQAARPLIVVRDTTTPDSLLPPDRRVVFDSVRPARTMGTIVRDSAMLELLRVGGFIATEYKADAAVFTADSGRLDLMRSAEVTREGVLIAADSSITYFEERGQACARGRPTVTGGEMSAPLEGDSLCYYIERKLGVARGARTMVSETGASWYVDADELVCEGEGNQCWSHSAKFTDCDEEEPHYHFSAKEMKVIRGNIIVARNVTLCFDDVCVAWLPFFVQSMGRDRASGILMPRFGVNDIARRNARYSRQIEDIGVYWAVSDYMGAELAMDWRSDDFTALRGSLDFRFLRQFLNGGLTYRKFWKAEGGSDFTVATMATWEPDERTRLAVDGNYATSTQFVRNRSLDPRELNRSIDTNLGVSRRFDWGSVNLKGQRNQYLSDNSVRMVLPSLGVNLSSITLFPALPGQESWYSNITWTASGDTRLETRSLGEENINPTLRDQRDWTGRLSSSFNLGAFALSQQLSADDRIARARDVANDTLPGLPERVERRLRWNTTLNYQQRLVGTSTLTPGLSIRGGSLRADTTGLETIAEPTRIDLNAALRTDMFGFWPGVGPFERIRHRFSPSITYAYSPAPTVTDRQREVFGIGEVREQNRLSIGFSQTFEAKYEEEAPERQGAGADTTAAAAAPADSAGAFGETDPRRRVQARKLTLLSISTDALVYDFVRAREEGDGIVTTAISNSLQSDLLRGFQLGFTHDLFRTSTPIDSLGTPSGPPERDFAPHLSRVSASFSLNSSSGLARFLGLGRRESEATPPPTEAQDTTGLGTPEAEAGPAVDRTQGEMGVVGTRRRSTGPVTREPVGTWNASFTYTMFRPREADFGSRENQMLTAQVSFQPTVNWQVHWNTGYSFTDSQFTDHILTLTRNLHDWDANFDFVKAQNGNFSFQFRVNLRANPDIKIDYEQRDLEGLQRVQAR